MNNNKYKSCEDAFAMFDNMSYDECLDWLERMTTRYTQHLCFYCELWHIWKLK